jgi:para-aminobenzoate synthetase/4-amino-4-deoxychorismate lyase
MIVDLLRNDLGRVARTGSVRVAELFAVERYRTVLQMTSTVEARVAPAVGLADLFAALFPCGSVTGAPKIAATRLIAALERSTRGPYCGAIGVVAPGGDAVFNVGIRTLDLDLDGGAATYGVGGGSPGSRARSASGTRRWRRRRCSTSPRTTSTLETLRLSGASTNGSIGTSPARRLRALLRVPLDLAAVRAALDSESRRAPQDGARPPPRPARRRAPTEAAPLPPRARPAPGRAAREPVDREDRFLFHKTTRREVYERRRAERPDAFDVLLSNREGELTELTIGNLVAEIDGELLTPAQDAGLLAGTMRAELLDRGLVREAVLRREDLGRARRLWLVNTRRGWVPIRMV